MTKRIIMIFILLMSTNLMAEMNLKKGALADNVFEKLDNLVVTYENMRCNNFSISEEVSMFSGGLSVLTVTASARNKSKKSKNLVISMMGQDKNANTLWQINIAPDFDTVGANKTSEIKGDVYVEPDSLKKTTVIYYRLIGN